MEGCVMPRYPEHIQEIVTKYGLKPDDLWQVQSTWVIKHKAVERIGAQLGICWDAPTIIEGKTDALTVVVVVTGRLGERVEWSFGECSPSNYRVSGRMQAYPWAMAEKRGKDRVILKFLAVYGDVYGEDESEDFKNPQTPHTVDEYDEPEVFPADPDADRKSAHFIKKNRPNEWPEVVSKLREATSVDDLKAVSESEYFKKMTKDWPLGFLDELRAEYQSCKNALTARAAA